MSERVWVCVMPDEQYGPLLLANTVGYTRAEARETYLNDVNHKLHEYALKKGWTRVQRATITIEQPTPKRKQKPKRRP